MQRRSFFGVVCGGLLARWFPWRRPLRVRDADFKGQSLLRYLRDREGPIALPPPAQRLIMQPTEIERWVARGHLDRDEADALLRTIAPGQQRLQHYSPPRAIA